jgi:phage-related protein
MRFINSKYLFSLLIVVLLGLTAFFGWKSYESYRAYETARDDLSDIMFIRKLNNLADVVAKERTASALFMGTSGKNGEEFLSKARAEVDEKIRQVRQKTYNNRNYATFVQDLEYIVKKLAYARNMVDTLGSDYRNIYVVTFHDDIYHTLQKVLKRIISRQHDTQNRDLLKLFTDMPH